MVSIWTSLQAEKGKIVLLRPTEPVQKVFQATQLDRIFQIFTDEAEAIAFARTEQ